MKYILGFFVLMFCLKGNSQFSALSYKQKYYDEMKKNTTYFVLIGDPEYDSSLVRSMRRIWTLTPYETLYVPDWKKYKLKKGYNYVLDININVIRIGSITGDKTYHNFGILVGDDSKLGSFDYQSMIAYSPIDHYGEENNHLDMAYRFPLLVFNLQNSIELVVNKEIKGNSASMVKQMRDIYCANSGILKKKTLLISQDRPKLLSKEEFDKVYDYKFEYCSKEKIKKAIDERDSNYAILIPQITVNKSIFVYDAATYNPLYLEIQMMGLKINDGDIKDLNSSIKKSPSNRIVNSFYTLPISTENKKEAVGTEKIIKDSLLSPAPVESPKPKEDQKTIIERIKEEVKAKESLKPETKETKPEVAAKTEELTRPKDSTKASAKNSKIKGGKQKEVAKAIDTTPPKTLTDNIPVPNPQYSDVNAAVKAEIDARNAAIDAANRKASDLDAKIKYYKDLRVRYEEEEKIRQEKEKIANEEKAKRDLQAFDNRHLKEEDAPQFDKYRNGAQNPKVKKPTAEEDYNKLFK